MKRPAMLLPIQRKFECRIGLWFVFVGLYAPALTAQVVTSEPAFPNEQESITITFHADQGNRGLAGFTGNVYAHTGVITNQSNSPSDWRYVVAGWRDTSSPAQMTRVAPDTYEITLQDIRAFYKVPASERIRQLAFVFWGVNAGEGKDEGDQDIFVDLFEAGVNVRFIEPEVRPLRPAFVEQNGSLMVTAIGSGLAQAGGTLHLYVNAQQVATTATDTLHYEIIAGGGVGKTLVRVTVEDPSGTELATDTFDFHVNPNLVDAPVPAGVVDGINPINATSVTLSLYAPHKAFVYVIGDFNDWQITPAYFMNRDLVNEDSMRFWLTLDMLDPQTEYAFQYLVDGTLRIADPYTEKVLDPREDRFISQSLYPNLKPYPAGQTEEMVSVFQIERPAYDWQATDFQRPAQKDLVIYELLVRDFIAAHDFTTLTDTLDYLQRLGINAIELMPINEFEGNSSWGYNPAFYFAPDKYYGPASTLKRFIDACHERGIAVILDVVYNHNFGQSPLVRLYNVGGYGQPTPENPWLNPAPKHDFNVGYDFNHESFVTQQLMDRANTYWLREYHVDGFRFDLSKGFTQRNTLGNVGAWGNYDASRVQLIKRMVDQVWRTDSTAYIILEHFAENREEKELAEYGTNRGMAGIMLWGNLNRNYNEATMGYHNGGKSDVSWGYYGTRNWAVPNLITYMESHDEERLMFKNLKFGNRNEEYDTRDLATALDRMKLAATFFLTLPGPKMIWQFGELGYEVDINFNGRTGEKPIRWNYQNDALRAKLLKTYAGLIRLRQEHEVFRSPETVVGLAVRNAIKHIHLSHPSMQVVIAGNFDVVAQNVTPAFPHAGTWYTFFAGDSLNIANPDTAWTFPAGNFYLFTDKPITSSEPGLITVDTETKTEPATFTVQANYPNPFKQSTTLHYILSAPSVVQIEVFDILGQRISKLVDDMQQAGPHSVVWEAKHHVAGTYWYRIKAGHRIHMQKMVLIR